LIHAYVFNLPSVVLEWRKGVIMKICICSSLAFADEVLEISMILEASGHEVMLPNGIINRLAEQPNFDPVQAKIETKSNHLHAEKIRECDAVLMCNFPKNCTQGYIGANCFAELYLAQYFEKPIFSLFPLPNIPYINDEIRSFGITVLNNELNLLPPENGSFASNPEPYSPISPAPADQTPMQPIPSMPIPADPSALPPNPTKVASMSATPDTPDVPITSEDVHRNIPAESSHNPLKQVRDSWFSIWGKRRGGDS